jgi:hypothetical protein
MIALGFWLALSAPQKLVEPVVPAGSNRSFQEAVIAVEESLSKSDFEAEVEGFATNASPY